jgi:ketosteroid isomerase-like protein
MEALRALEADRDLDAVVSMFSDDCSVGNVVLNRDFKGREGARDFWSQYRATFGEVSSSFRNVIAAGGRVALEWQSEATNQEGAPLKYEGVSILEVDGDKITRFYAYFDPREVSEQLASEAKGAGHKS